MERSRKRTSVVDWAPYSDHGDEFRVLPPIGMSYSLTTDDLCRAKPLAATKRYLHGEMIDKRFPEEWLPEMCPFKYKHLDTNRSVNPLTPEYKLPSGRCLLPVGDLVPLSNRITDLLDTSDIAGSKPAYLTKRIIRRDPLPDDPGFHPTKQTHERHRTTIGQGLDLFDINIGKKQFGFRREIVSNPLEPHYPNEARCGIAIDNKWMKRKVLPPHRDDRGTLEKILDKVYCKVDQFPMVCTKFDPNNTKQISYKHFQKSLEEFGVKLSEAEMNEVAYHTDKDHTGYIRYNKFAKILKGSRSWEYSYPKRLGEDVGAKVGKSNLGQGVQVLEESKFKGKKMNARFGTISVQYDIVTGDPIPGTGFMNKKEPLYSSYAEKAAAAHKLKLEQGWLQFCPRRLAPIENSELSIGAHLSPSTTTEMPQNVGENVPNTNVMAATPNLGIIPNVANANMVGNVPTNNVPTQEIIQTIEPKKPKLILQKKISINEYNLGDIPPIPRFQKIKRMEAPKMFRQRIFEEQKSADLSAVMFLT